MMKRLFAALLCLALLLAQGFSASLAQGGDAGRVQSLIDGILACELERAGASDVQAWLDGELASSAGRGGEWNVFALSQMGGYSLDVYRDALLDELGDPGTLSAISRQKLSLILLATGGGEEFQRRTMAETIGAQGIMTWIYGLHLLNNGLAGSVTAQQAVEKLLELQLDDGGWALWGETSDVDVTAMALQALAPHRQEAAVAQSIERALALLCARQMDTGDFASFGKPNPESAAQVVTVLASLGVNAFEDERFIRGGQTLLDVICRYRLADGSFAHEAGGAGNQNATVQTLCALVAWQRMMDGRGSIYQIDRAQSARMQARLEPKAAAALVMAALALAACLWLVVVKKRNRKNALFVLAVAAALIAFVLHTDFQSADSYYTGEAVVKQNPIGRVAMSVRCDTALGRVDLALPEDGVMLPETEFAIAQGDTVYTLLDEAARAYGLRLDTSGTQGMIYVRGINHLYEFACGELSGWTYRVNGRPADVGCAQYEPQDGDVIEWLYTCELGSDLK